MLIAATVFITTRFFKAFFPFLKGKIGKTQCYNTINIGNAGQLINGTAY